jgi:hypothetical protein
LRFVMYTEKSVPQAMSAINERLHTPGTKSRPQLDGWVEKSGRFSMGITGSVKWRLMRRTVLQGKAEKLGNITLIQGSVPGGVSGQGMLVILGALIAVAVLVYTTQNNAILAGVALLAGVVLYIPLVGDFNNCETLLSELQKSVNAKFTPPSGKTTTASASAAAVRPASKPATRITKAKPAVKSTAKPTAKASGAKTTVKKTSTTARKPASKSTSKTARKTPA